MRRERTGEYHAYMYTATSDVGHPRRVDEKPDDIWVEYAAQLGMLLSRARTAKGLSQEQVAHAAGIASFTLNKLESGHSNPQSPANPRLRTLVAIAQVLDVPVATLIPPDPASVRAWK